MRSAAVMLALAAPVAADDAVPPAAETWTATAELTGLFVAALDLSVERAITKQLGVALLVGAGSSTKIVVGDRVYETESEAEVTWQSVRIGGQFNAYARAFSGAHGGVEVVHVRYLSPSPAPDYDSVGVTDLGGYLGWKWIERGFTGVVQLGAKYFHTDLPDKQDDMAVLANFALGYSW